MEEVIVCTRPTTFSPESNELLEGTNCILFFYVRSYLIVFLF